MPKDTYVNGESGRELHAMRVLGLSPDTPVDANIAYTRKEIRRAYDQMRKWYGTQGLAREVDGNNPESIDNIHREAHTAYKTLCDALDNQEAECMDRLEHETLQGIFSTRTIASIPPRYNICTPDYVLAGLVGLEAGGFAGFVAGMYMNATAGTTDMKTAVVAGLALGVAGGVVLLQLIQRENLQHHPLKRA